MNQTSLPHSIDAEQALVARLLVDPEMLPALKLDASDIYDRDLRDAYRAMREISSQRKNVDLVTIQGELGRRVDIPILELTAAHTAPLESYAEIIRRDAFRRRFIESLERTASTAYIEEDRQKLLVSLQDTTSAILSGVESDHLYSASQAVDKYLASVEKRKQGQGRGLTYGLVPLDKVIQPAGPGDLIILAARPSVGKTSLLEYIVDQMSHQTDHPILFVSIEMGLNQLTDRAVARTTGLSLNRIVRSDLNDDEWQTVASAAETMRERKIVYERDPYATTPTIRASASKVKMVWGGIGAIAVDYLQKVNDTDGGGDERIRITRIVRMLKNIAGEFECPMLVPSQLSRGVEMREDKHPKLSDLRETGAIEDEADLVLGLHRRHLSSPELDVEVLKNRIGGNAGAMIPMHFDLDHSRFAETAVGEF